MKSLPDSLLESFSGYLELGMFAEAAGELDRVPDRWKSHPAVQLGRLDLLIEKQDWEGALLLAADNCRRMPDFSEFHFRRAYCQHELKRTAEARETLLQGPPEIRRHAVFFYNLACYEAQLGNLGEAKQQLGIAIRMDKSFRSDALTDPDLQPLRPSP